MLDLDLIRLDGGTQTRAELNQEVVAAYAEAYKTGADMPAVVVFYDGSDRWLADGFHRYFGAKAAGLKEILETVTPGTKQEALVYALGANGKHGLQRTNADKRHAAELALGNAVLGKLSDREIARVCGVAHPLVGEVRAAIWKNLPDRPPAAPEDRTVTVTRKGKTFEQKTGSGKKSDAGKKKGKAKPETPAAEPTKPASKPAKVEPEDQPYEGPSEAEIAATLAAVAADDAALKALLEADDKLAAVVEENKRLTAEVAVLKLSRDGYMNRTNELIRRVKWLKGQLKKATQNDRRPPVPQHDVPVAGAHGF